MTRALTVLLAVALPSTALAWEHLGQMWCAGEFPLQYEISTYEEDSLEDPDYAAEAIKTAYDKWTVAECAEVSYEFTGMVEENTNFSYDFVNRHTFDDPGDRLAPGVLAATVNAPQFGAPICEVKNGETYTSIFDSDIVFNDNVDWATDEDIRAGNCNGEHSIHAVAVHEIGHQWGLGHSCEEDDVCGDPELREATMYWSDGTCSLAQADINIDDIRSIQALYGPQAGFVCSHEQVPGSSDTMAVGNVGMDLKCRMVSDDPEEVTGATWYWGDGTTSTEIDASHTYTEPGNYTVRVCFDGVRDTCGDWQFCTRREGYVRVCDVPEPEFRASHVNGLTYDLLNETDLSVYGCIFEVQWDIFDPSGEKVGELKGWEPKYTFADEGEHRIVLNVGGPAGTGAAELVLDVRNRAGEGYGACNSLGGAGGVGFGAIAMLGALVLRRRRADTADA